MWIAAPAGAGKTSLVSTWLESRHIPHVWYQVDAGDADPASLFHFLRLAASDRPKHAEKLPRLTPDRVPGLAVFARRFFEAYFSGLPRGSAVVFDDCHAATSNSPFFQILAVAWSAVPAGQLFVCISREDIPDTLARLIPETGTTILGADELRLTTDEARAIARRVATTTPIEKLNEIVRGWPAGFRLLLGLDGRRRIDSYEDEKHLQRIFDYFAVEVFNQSPAEIRDFLVRTAVPPRINATTACVLTGRNDAREILARLHRNRLFTDRRDGFEYEPVYEYHPLFREFLLNRGRRMLAASERTAITREAAAWLEQSGSIEDAAALLVSGEDWTALSRLIRSHAPRLAEQGRFATLAAWTAAMPPGQIDADPWLVYWRGESLALSDPPAARRNFEHAYAMFRLTSDVDGQATSLAGILRTYFMAMIGHRDLDHWIAELEVLLDVASDSLPPEAEARLIASAIGIIIGRPEHPVVVRLSIRGHAVIRRLSELSHRLGVAFYLCNHSLFVGEFGHGRTLAEQFPPFLDAEAPWAWSGFGVWYGSLLWQDAEHELAFAVLDKALCSAREHGFPLWESQIHIHTGFTALSAGDLDRVDTAITAGYAATSPSRLVELVQLRSLEAAAMLRRGQVKEAISRAEEILATISELGTRFGEATHRIQFGQMLMLDGQHRRAREHLHAALAFAMPMNSHILQFQVLMALAWSNFQTDEIIEGDALLHRALSIGAEHQYMNCHPVWIPEVIAQLCERALRTGFKVEYVRALIRKRRLVSPSIDVPNWPWLVEIRALGGFTILVDGRAIPVDRKPQRKVLDLLKTIVAWGGRLVSADALKEALWPDSDGDAANGALEVTLHRLRRLLGSDQAIMLSSGRISLNEAVCHLDVWMFERVLERLNTLRRDPSAGHDRLESAARDLVDSYSGHLLAGEAETIAPPSRVDRLQDRFASAVRVLGDLLERERLLDSASALYEHAIGVNPVDEEAYRRQMRLLIRRGKNVDAVRLYTQCEKALARLVGVSPSLETESIIASLRRS